MVPLGGCGRMSVQHRCLEETPVADTTTIITKTTRKGAALSNAKLFPHLTLLIIELSVNDGGGLLKTKPFPFKPPEKSNSVPAK